jgi:hypothetical protein
MDEKQLIDILRRREALSNKTYSKIFGIGHNKTGTTTLEAILKIHGFNVPNQQEQATVIVKQFFRGNYNPFREFVEKFDAFRDLPFSEGYSYLICDALFPNSKFILTLREPDDWFNSINNAVKKFWGVELNNLTEDHFYKFRYLKEEHIYSAMERSITSAMERSITTVEDGEIKVRFDLLGNKEFAIKKYIDRNNEIIKYFKDRPTDLLIIDVTKEEYTGKICEFLGIPDKYKIKMPHKNKT